MKHVRKDRLKVTDLEGEDPHYRYAVRIACNYEAFSKLYKNSEYTAAVEYQFRKAFINHRSLKMFKDIDTAMGQLQRSVGLALSAVDVQGSTARYANLLRRIVDCGVDNIPETIHRFDLKENKARAVKSMLLDPEKSPHILADIELVEKYDAQLRLAVKEAVHHAVAECILMQSQEQQSWRGLIADQRIPDTALGNYLM